MALPSHSMAVDSGHGHHKDAAHFYKENTSKSSRTVSLKGKLGQRVAGVSIMLSSPVPVFYYSVFYTLSCHRCLKPGLHSFSPSCQRESVAFRKVPRKRLQCHSGRGSVAHVSMTAWASHTRPPPLYDTRRQLTHKGTRVRPCYNLSYASESSGFHSTASGRHTLCP